MTLIKGYCFRSCNECAIFQATKQDNNIRRAEIAATLSEIYDDNLEPSDINCDGCTTTNGKLFKFALDCSVRNRTLKKGAYSIQ